MERYGSDAQVRIGLMSDINTDPTIWWGVEFMSIAITQTRERKPRPKIGAPRTNPLDPIKPRPGFFKESAAVVLDGDTRQLPIWLRVLLGAPATTGPVSSIYTHVWNTGASAQIYACIQIKSAASQVRVLRGVVLSTLSTSFSGETTQDFDFNLGLRALSRGWSADWLAGATINALPAEAPVYRAIFKQGGTAVAQSLSGQWSWDRKIVEDAFLSTTATLAALRPGGDAGLTGQAALRDDGEAWDTLEEGDTIINPLFQFVGSVTGHEIDMEHTSALLQGIPFEIKGPDLIERTINWTAFQDATHNAGKITVKNDTVSYASA